MFGGHLISMIYGLLPPLLTAVFAACGWPSDLSDEEILERLLALNLERSRSRL
jgi:hypothetical protein